MRSKHLKGEKKSLFIIASIVLLTVLLSSSYSYATNSQENTDRSMAIARTQEADLLMTDQAVVIKKPLLPQTSSGQDIRYETMTLNSTTALTSQDLDLIFLGTGMEGLGRAFKAAEEAYGINASALAAIGIHESAWGASAYARQRNNLFGFGAYTSNPDAAVDFSSLDGSIDIVASFVKEHYLKEDGKYYRNACLDGMNEIYAADPNWKHNIASIWERMENGYFIEKNTPQH